MVELNSFDLISGRDIFIEQVGFIRQPLLSDIKKIGFQKYETYLNCFLINVETFIEQAGAKERFDTLPDDVKSQCNIYDFLIARDETRALLFEALSFFIAQKLVFNPQFKSFDIISDSSVIGRISHESFEDIRNAIMQFNFIQKPKSLPPKGKNKKANEILEKLKKGRKQAAKARRTDENMSLANIISSVSIFHNSYNLTNIWELTVYQLYDQFFRQNQKIQFNVYGSKWAAWGKDEFDFSIWHKAMKTN